MFAITMFILLFIAHDALITLYHCQKSKLQGCLQSFCAFGCAKNDNFGNALNSETSKEELSASSNNEQLTSMSSAFNPPSRTWSVDPLITLPQPPLAKKSRKKDESSDNKIEKKKTVKKKRKRNRNKI